MILDLKLKKCLDENPGIRGIMLGSHGLFTWGDTAYESYINTLEVIERCAEYLEDNIWKEKPVFGGAKNSIIAKRKTIATGSCISSCITRLLFFSDKYDRSFY